MLPVVSCLYHKTCSGCSHWEVPFDQQLLNKAQLLKEQIESTLGTQQRIQVESLAPFGLRDYLSFTFKEGRFGFDKNQKEIVDLSTCLQSSPSLQDFLYELYQSKASY